MLRYVRQIVRTFNFWSGIKTKNTKNQMKIIYVLTTQNYLDLYNTTKGSRKNRKIDIIFLMTVPLRLLMPYLFPA